jgi:hypothetical protein
MMHFTRFLYNHHLGSSVDPADVMVGESCIIRRRKRMLVLLTDRMV